MADFIPGHRLSRQILATLIANDLINRMGPSFVKRVQDDTGADIVTIARAYTIAKQICRAEQSLQDDRVAGQRDSGTRADVDDV